MEKQWPSYYEYQNITEDLLTMEMEMDDFGCYIIGNNVI